MAYEANTLRDTLFNNWTLTGRMAKEGTANVENPIRFFAHDELEGRQALKSIDVKKTTPKQTERRSEFFKLVEDSFEITVNYPIMAASIKEEWDNSESDVEDIEEEIERILRTVYNPFNFTGGFYTMDTSWTNMDQLNSEAPMILRKIRLTLTKIVPRSQSVYSTYNRGVVLDGASLTEVFDISSDQGFEARELPIANHSLGKGIRLQYSGGFSGVWTARSYLHHNDFGPGASDVNTLMLRNWTGNEVKEVTVVETYRNEVGNTLTKTTVIRITNIREEAPQATPMIYQITGKIIKPSTWSLA